MTGGLHRRAVLFDVDGVLLDSVAAHQAVWRRWAGERGLDPAAVVLASNGRRPEDTVRMVAPALDPATERMALDELTRRSPAVVREFAGAAALLRSLPQDRWAIVTSGSAWYVQRAFRRCRLPLPAVQVYGEDVIDSKPAPDGYLLACRRMGARPSDCMVLEDSPAGVLAGKAAGCLVLALTGVPPTGPLAHADVWAPGLPEAAPVIKGWLAGGPGSGRACRECPVKAPPVRWGIVATGRIAATFTEDLRTLPAAEVAAVASRSLGRARQFAARHGIPRAYGDWRQLAADPGVDVVYVATPHAAHHCVSAVMLDAGKAVLCEKPLALDAGQATDLICRARRRGVFLMEAMWTRCLPAIRAMTAVIGSGDIGEPRLVVADFGFAGPDDPRHRLRDPSLGGGALLDIGVYLASLSHLVLGPPTGVSAAATLTPEGVDASATMMLTCESGALASLACSIVAETPTVAAICGTAGRIVLGRRFYAAAGFQLWHGERVTRQVRAPYLGHGLAHEAEEVMRCLAEGRTESPLVPLTASVSVLRTLDEARAQAGVRYPDPARISFDAAP